MTPTWRSESLNPPPSISSRFGTVLDRSVLGIQPPGILLDPGILLI